MAILHYFQFLFVSVILVFKLMTAIRFGISIVTLGCTDMAKWPPHPRSMWCLARDAAACATNRVQFFFLVSGFALTRVDSAPTRADLR